MRRIKEISPKLAEYYPTQQLTRNALKNRTEIWWVDHYTTGISHKGTLNWFSSKKHKRNGKMRFAGASTHFVQPFHGLPFMIIPLQHGAWHEPRRNRDSIAVEYVNPGRLHKEGTQWRYWAGDLPDELVRELPPVLLDHPFRGAKVMLPFTKDQLVASIKLKRIVRVYATGCLDAVRMSQHTDWREGKQDMGPLWPMEDLTDAAFSHDNLEELDFLQTYDVSLDDSGTVWDGESFNDKVEAIRSTPDRSGDTATLMPTEDIQMFLNTKGANLTTDGIWGPKTKEALRLFQSRWNKQMASTLKPNELLKMDGIPGPETCKRIKENKERKVV